MRISFVHSRFILPYYFHFFVSSSGSIIQKPLHLLARIILASTKEDAWIMDPFTGSSTTGIAASLLNRRFLGIDQDENYLLLSKARRLELDNLQKRREYKVKMEKHIVNTQLEFFNLNEIKQYYGNDLPIE